MKPTVSHAIVMMNVETYKDEANSCDQLAMQ